MPIEKKIKKETVEVGIYICIFLLLLICNLLTPYIMDDFTYAYSFATGKRLESVLDIFPSMAAHAQTMNGRLVAHGIVQMFALLPNWCFDLVNAAVFLAQIELLVRVCGCENKRSLASVAAFCCIWLFELAFGQVNLWQDGAVNYLWSIPVCCLFLLPYVQLYVSAKNVDRIGSKVLFLVVAFLAGAYSETVSAASIFMAMVILGLCWIEKEKIAPVFGAALAVACLGYISIYLAPAQWMNKSVEPSLGSILSSFLGAVYKYEEIGVLLIPYAVLVILSFAAEVNYKRIRLSVVFLLGSLAANFILVFAGYYPGRAAVGAFVFLLAANLVLLPALLECERFRLLLVCSCAVLALVTVPRVIHGSRDIALCYIKLKNNEQTILEKRESGVRDIEVAMIYEESVYCALSDNLYLSTVNPNQWMNTAMARYYEVGSIIAR